MSGVPFNPMRKAPPKPPPVDTSDFDPKEYITVESMDGHLFLVHCECLRMSPFLRRALAKRTGVSLEDVVVQFMDEASESVPYEGVKGGVSAKNSSNSETFSMQPNPADRNNIVSVFRSCMSNGHPTDDAYARDSEGGQRTHASVTEEVCTNVRLREEVQLPGHELQNDLTVRITFPKLSAATVSVVIAYLYYKQRYEGDMCGSRPAFNVPTASAIEIMKVASTLEC